MTPEGLIIENMFRIANKDGDDMDFTLNSVQKEIDDTITGRDLYPKARQEGVSSYFLARYLAACLSRRNTRAVVISHDQESTQRMLLKVKYFINHMKGAKPMIKNNSANEITFPRMDSMFYIGTAGSRKFGRGDTITHLHCSEYALWPNPVELVSGLFQAVPRSGEIAIESTGYGQNDYAARCMRAAKGDSIFALHFFNWQDFPEYTEEVTDEEASEILSSLDPELEEEKLVPTLTPGQIKWRRGKLEEMGYDIRRFNREYPMTLDDCFKDTKESIFYKVLYNPTKEWDRHPMWLKSWVLDGHPDPSCTYVLGADVAAGVDRDASAIEVICIDTMEQVGEYVDNKVAPDTFADNIMAWGELFYWPLAVVEQNNHGLVTLSYMRGRYPGPMIYRMRKAASGSKQEPVMRMGYRTTERTKPLMIGNLRRLLAEELVIHSAILMGELTTYVEDDMGKLGAASNCHDDTVMAMACAGIGIEKAMITAGRKWRGEEVKKVPGFLDMETILDELHSRGKKFPIAPQHSVTLTDRDRNP